jgi:hypothetical protein
MARTPKRTNRVNPKTASETAAARLKALKAGLAPAPKLGARPATAAKLIVRQPASPLSAAHAARLKSIHAQVRAFRGR